MKTSMGTYECKSQHPFNSPDWWRERMEIVVAGKDAEIASLKERIEVMALKEKVKALEAANAKYKSALGHIGSDKEYGECDLDYDGKVCNCKGCEDTRIAREALRED